MVNHLQVSSILGLKRWYVLIPGPVAPRFKEFWIWRSVMARTRSEARARAKESLNLGPQDRLPVDTILAVA
jgi:hypothetical protein